MSLESKPGSHQLSADEQRFIELFRLIPDQRPVIDLIIEQASLSHSPDAIAELVAAINETREG